MQELKPPTKIFYVATDGSDDNPGTRERPFATLARAKEVVRQQRQNLKDPISVVVRNGTYYLEQPLIFEAGDSGTTDARITYTASFGELVTISGGKKLDCNWKHYRDGIWMCDLLMVKEGKLNFTQLFINGKRQIRARYPNYDGSDPKQYLGYIQATGKIGDDISDPHPSPDDDMTFSGGAPRGINFDPDTFSRIRWKKPWEAVIHIYQAYYWGNLQWQVKDIDWDNCRIWFGKGGQQIGAKFWNDPCEVNDRSRFYIENVFEELDTPGEWYLNRDEGVLYYMPEEGVDLKNALVEVPVLQKVVSFSGAQDDPVHHITLKGFRFTHTAATFLEPYTIPSLSDWSIHRGGAVFMEGSRDCTIKNCYFEAVGGNAAFMNNYNRRNTITGCKFVNTGDSAICFVGSLETTLGTQRNFPYECQATNNLIHDCGVFGKQIAGVYISRAKCITISHNEIFNMPRAGICIGDGTWGGHVIEYNHIHETCLETSDQGPFNAWGRDRHWCFTQAHMQVTENRSHEASRALVDAMEPVIVRHNYFIEDAGWGLDLDDGASNYEIYNNLCVGVSMKLREGAYRTVYNNIWVNGVNSPGFHIGNEDNHDRYYRNITVMTIRNAKPENDLNFAMDSSYGEIYTLIFPPVFSPWLEEIDYNCFYSDLGKFVARVIKRVPGRFDESWKDLEARIEKYKFSLEEWQALGFDQHSVFADPQFINPEHGDYRVRPESPALKLGFVNFDAREAGLTADFPEQWKD